jgi:MoaA/NifB/PqqE/SkfB family radical SAM enzyme
VRWVEALNRLCCREDLPVTLQGGEPGLHPDFLWIIKNIKRDLNIDILTNLSFDVDDFINEVKPRRLNRGAPYPNIRVSYHPPYMDLDGVVEKVLRLQGAGFSVGIFGILHPAFKDDVLAAQKRYRDLGIDFRTKEFLGEYEQMVHGTYRYPDAVGHRERKRCLCRTSELIVGPDGGVYRCHHDLYKDFPPLGNILDPDFEIEDAFRGCDQFGDCNPCDIKVKTDRFQVFGHTSVEIKEIVQARDEDLIDRSAVCN